MVLLPGTAPGIPAYTVKVHAKNASRQPALVGVICLHDYQTGDLLAVMDSGWLTALRTGMSAAIGTHELAHPEADIVGVVGAGVQSRALLSAFSGLRSVRSVHIYDVDSSAAEDFGQHVRAVYDTQVVQHDSARSVTSAATILMVATWSRESVLMVDDVVPGTHVTSLGSDEVGKLELDRHLFTDAFVVSDDLSLAEGILPRIDTTLSSVLRNEDGAELRADRGRITIYSPVGLPAQDCVVAWHAYSAALKLSLGTWRDLET
jgi:ornithine cyclodeaminase/alanine dehydrogenase-like protein (mu-crystallin family)